MERLKPCPFCGGKAAIAQNASVFLDYRVYCKRCGAETGMYTTAIKAVRCWNTREERECMNIDNYKAFGEFTCSECGDHWRDFVPDTFHYCPRCGAKVVKR